MATVRGMFYRFNCTDMMQKQVRECKPTGEQYREVVDM